MPRTKPHGHKRKHLFKVGDLVRWNRWHTDSDWIKVDGSITYKKQVKSHLGIVLEVYQSNSKARCWVADVNFMDSVRNYQNEPEYSVPLSCLQVIE